MVNVANANNSACHTVVASHTASPVGEIVTPTNMGANIVYCAFEPIMGTACDPDLVAMHTNTDSRSIVVAN